MKKTIYLRRRRAAKPAKASRERVAVVGSGMTDREIISLYENYCIVTNIKIEGWEPTKNEH